MKNKRETIMHCQYICPLCKQDLEWKDKKYYCSICKRSYEVFCGIPNFTFNAKIRGREYHLVTDYPREIASDYERLSHRELVMKYWVKDRPEWRWYRNEYPGLSDKELRKEVSQMWAKARLQRLEQGRQIIKTIEKFVIDLGINKEVWGKKALDVACGSGKVLISLASKCEYVWGFDLKYDDLLLTKKLASENSIDNVSLCCAYAEFLPYRNRFFDIITAHAVLEHIENKNLVFGEIERVFSQKGWIYLNSVNRYLLREPHTNVPLVGFLPSRRLMDWHVRLFAHRPYSPKDYQLIGLREFTHFLHINFCQGYKWYLYHNLYLDLLYGKKIQQLRKKCPFLYTTIRRISPLRKLLQFLYPLRLFDYKAIITYKG